MTQVPQAPAVRRSYTIHQSPPILRDLADEQPIAFEYNGVAYAVMMGSSSDLEDFAVGFSLGEGLIERAEEIEDLMVQRLDEGWIVRIQLPMEQAARLHDRVRLRVAEGSCGLCGLESIQQVLRPLPNVRGDFSCSPEAVLRALECLLDWQPLGRLTGAMHVAAFSDAEGTILCAREDVGRHNALDKLIGALARDRIRISDGFVLVSARCSYELVEKTVRAGCPMLVSISAASNLAIERAKEANLTLVALARHDNMLVFHDPTGMLTEQRYGI